MNPPVPSASLQQQDVNCSSSSSSIPAAQSLLIQNPIQANISVSVQRLVQEGVFVCFVLMDKALYVAASRDFHVKVFPEIHGRLFGGGGQRPGKL